MADPGKMMLNTALMVQDAQAKALAAFLFRDVIEEAHTKYNISQEDMKEMCRDAVNRAAMFLKIKDDHDLYRAFTIHAIEGTEWDNPEKTEFLKEELDLLRSIAG